MTISVAMCTYNGSAYLQEQLDSIAAQTRLPDEMVICDDCSNDGTAAILEAFAGNAPFPVHLHRNESNLGSTANFDQAIRLCQGDLIALSDQDDVWQPEKLRRLTEPFADLKVGLVFSNAEVVDDDLNPLGMKLWDVYFPPKLQRQMQQGQGFEVQMRQNVVTGATMVFRADLRGLIQPIPSDVHLIHDGWIALVAAAVSRIVFVPECLILYRKHSSQQVGINLPGGLDLGRVLPRTHYVNHLHQLATVHTRLSTRIGEHSGEKLIPKVRRLQAHSTHIQARLALPVNGLQRIPFVLKELATGHYHRYSNGFQSVARDFLYSLDTQEKSASQET